MCSKSVWIERAEVWRLAQRVLVKRSKSADDVLSLFRARRQRGTNMSPGWFLQKQNIKRIHIAFK